MKFVMPALFILMLLSGCVLFFTWDGLSQTWVGLPIDKFIEQEGPPDGINTRTEGSKVYRYHLEEVAPNCVHYWIVNSKGIIVDFYYEGACTPVG